MYSYYLFDYVDDMTSTTSPSNTVVDLAAAEDQQLRDLHLQQQRTRSLTLFRDPNTGTLPTCGVCDGLLNGVFQCHNPSDKCVICHSCVDKLSVDGPILACPCCNAAFGRPAQPVLVQIEMYCGSLAVATNAAAVQQHVFSCLHCCGELLRQRSLELSATSQHAGCVLSDKQLLQQNYDAMNDLYQIANESNERLAEQNIICEREREALERELDDTSSKLQVIEDQHDCVLTQLQASTHKNAELHQQLCQSRVEKNQLLDIILQTRAENQQLKQCVQQQQQYQSAHQTQVHAIGVSLEKSVAKVANAVQQIEQLPTASSGKRLRL